MGTEKDRKVEEDSNMLQTISRVPVAVVRRRWNIKHTGNIQESSTEISSSNTFSSKFKIDNGVTMREDIQLWDLDLHRGLRPQPNTDHYHTISSSAELTNNDLQSSPFSATVQGSHD